MKNASLQCDLRRSNFIPGINARLLCLVGLFAMTLLFLWPNAELVAASGLPANWTEFNFYSDNHTQSWGIPTTNYTVNGFDGTFNKIKFWLQVETSGAIDGTICAYDNYEDFWTDTISGQAYLCALASTSTLIFHQDTSIQAGQWTDFNLTNSFTFNPSKYYRMNFCGSTPCSGGVQTGIFKQGYGPAGNDYPVMVQYEAAAANSISIDFPPNATSTLDFDNWGISGYSSTTALIHINWGLSTSTWSGFTNYFLDSTGDFDISAPKSFSISPGTYYAQAWLAYCPAPYNLYSDCIPSTWSQPYGLGLLSTNATSTVISFTITGENPYVGGYYGDYYPTSTPTSTASSSEWVMTCDPKDNLWNKSLCQIAKWTVDGILGILKFLFIPRDADFNQFTNLQNLLNKKPPMGYFYAIKDAFTFNSTTTKAFDLASSTVAMASPIFDPLKAGLTFILWLLFAFWLFNRIKHFNL